MNGERENGNIYGIYEHFYIESGLKISFTHGIKLK